VYRIFEEYSDQVEFIHLDFDQPEQQQAARDLDMRSRSTYVLLDGEGNVVRQWIGPIQEGTMLAQMEALLADLGQ